MTALFTLMRLPRARWRIVLSEIGGKVPESNGFHGCSFCIVECIIMMHEL